MKISIAGVGLALLWGSLLWASAPSTIPAPPASRPAIEEIRLRNTYYYVVLESEYAKYAADEQIRDMQGNTLAYVSHAFRKAVDIEGTGRLVDGRVINYAGRIKGEIRYFISDAHWGYGVGQCKLVPFHTIAVDPEVVPLGSVVYIKETEGMILPDGTRHDGVWRADDIGSAIRKDRVDLFVGDGDQGPTLVRAGIHNLKPLSIEILTPPAADSCANQAPHP